MKKKSISVILFIAVLLFSFNAVAQINAVDDIGIPVNGPIGGLAVANVLSNDILNGNPANLSNVNLSVISSTSSNITLNLSDGSVNIAPGTPNGTYTIVYQICDKLNVTQCDTATITLTVTSIISVTLDGTYVDNYPYAGFPNPGDSIVYSIVVHNNGSLPLSNITITNDNYSNIAISGSLSSLAPGESNSTAFTGTYTITQTDIDMGIVYQLIIASATSSNGIESGTSTNPTPCNCPFYYNGQNPNWTGTILQQFPSIKLDKHGTYVDSFLPAGTSVGDTIQYDFTVTNTGNVTLTNINVYDPLVTVTGGPKFQLNVCEPDTTTFHASYTITQADIYAGQVNNSATTTGQDPYQNNITGYSTDPNPTPCGTCTPCNVPGCTITPLQNVGNTSTLVLNYDNFSLPPIYAGSNTPSVLANDTVNGIPIVNISSGGVYVDTISAPPGFTLNYDGTISVNSNLQEGAYNFVYRVCNYNVTAGDCQPQFAYIVVINNRITGEIQYDGNNNGCDSTDLLLNNVMVNNTVGTNNYATYTYSMYNIGHYILSGNQGNNLVTASGLPSYFTFTPSDYTFNFNSPSITNNVDFCITSNANVDDLEVVLTPLNNPRPGFQSNYKIWFKNNGSTTLSGQIAIQFNNSKMYFVTSSSNPVASTVNSETFSFSNLTPFESRILGCSFQLLNPPTAVSGDILSFNTSITPVSNDATPINNSNTFTQTCVNSYDPNNITVHEGATITQSQVTDYLHYTIQFQNTGTASAINVKVVDDLDSKLDWSTMQLLETSSNCRVDKNNGHVEFLFEGINLADSTTNEPLSHGYISYKIKPIASIAIGNVIQNNANIYFDYNAPIATNTATTTVVNNLSNDSFNFSHLNFYPNPVKNSLTISNNNTIDSVEITSILGQKMIVKTVNDLQTELDLSPLSNGVYFVKVTREGQEKTVKIVKE